MVARQSFDDIAAFCGAMKTNPARAADPLSQAEVDLPEHSQGVNPRLPLPENVVDAVVDVEVSRDWSAVDMDEQMNKWQKVRLEEVIQELQGRRTRRQSSCGQSFRRARTVRGGSLRPGVDSANSRSRSSAFTAISLPSGRPHVDQHGRKNRKRCVWWCAACSGHHDWRNPRSALVKQLGAPEEAKVYQARDPPWSICDHLIHARNVLANLQADVDRLVIAMFEALWAQGMIRVTETLRRFIEVDNDDAVRCAKLNQRRAALKVIKRRFNLGQHPEAAVREEADLLTLRQAEDGTQKHVPLR